MLLLISLCAAVLPVNFSQEGSSKEHLNLNLKSYTTEGRTNCFMGAIVTGPERDNGHKEWRI